MTRQDAAKRGWERLTNRFESDAAEGHCAGAVVRVMREGRPVYARAFGFQDRARHEQMQEDAIFRIASMTKPVVAVAALILMERGQLTLADPVRRHLPEFESLQVGTELSEPGTKAQLELQPAERAITVQDLFRHTSGLTTGLFGGSLVRARYHEVNIRDDQQTNADLVVKLGRLPLMYQPGSTFEYSMSTDVLGRLIEVLSGKDLNRFVREDVALPLGMSDTTFVLEGPQIARLAIPGAAGGNTALLPPYDVQRPPRWHSGGAGLLSTAGDYSRFCQMLLNHGELDGVRLLSRKTVDLMLSDHLPPGTRFGPNTRDLGIPAPMPEFGQSYGLGVGLRVRAGLSTVPGSVGDFFWGGALGTYFWADPAEHLSAILMMQELDMQKRARYRSLMRNLVYAALD